MFAGGVEDADLAAVDDGDDLMAGVFGADVDAGGAGVDGAVCGHHAGVHGGRGPRPGRAGGAGRRVGRGHDGGLVPRLLGGAAGEGLMWADLVIAAPVLIELGLQLGDGGGAWPGP